MLHTWLAMAALLVAVRAADDDDNSTNPCDNIEESGYNEPWHIAAVFIIFGTSLFGTIMPIMAHRWAIGVSKLPLACGKMFGAGVILATAFVHMFVPATKNLTSDCLEGYSFHDYDAFSGLFALIAMAMAQLLQITSASLLRSRSRNEETTALLGKTATDSTRITQYSTTFENNGHVSTAVAVEAVRTHIHAADEHNDHGHALLFDDRIEKHVSTYILELGIATHSVIIGITLGTSNEEFKSLLAALVFHQFFEGMSLATVLTESEFKLRTSILMVLFYSLTTPLGVGIGVALHSTYNENSVVNLISTGILDSVSAGILIYDSLVNIITPHVNGPTFRDASARSRALQLLCMWTGAAIMSMLGRWA